MRFGQESMFRIHRACMIGNTKVSKSYGPKEDLTIHEKPQ